MPYADAAGKTHIYIDQIPLYTELAPCAQGRLNDIVRNQFSGCGDDQQLTSFACFCIDSSSQFSSIISTAVAQQCSRSTGQAITSSALNRRSSQPTAAAARRGVGVRQITATPTGAAAQQMSSALEVWDSYCAKSTELARFNPTSSNAPATLVITQAPHTVTVGASPGPGVRTVPIAAIVVPAILFTLILLAGVFLFLRRSRMQRAQLQTSLFHRSMTGDDKNNRFVAELACEDRNTELQGSKLTSELEHPEHRAELDSGVAAATKHKSDRTFYWR
ncbi:Nn.00g083520.m01.CDS01 [Neocucurbitaria sp. VM-36]